MNKTANFQLTQWEKTDRIMMEDFNRDNAAIDAALKANADGVAAETAAREAADTALASTSGFQLLQTISCTNISENGNSGDFPLNIDWSQWAEICLIFQPKFSGNVSKYNLYFDTDVVFLVDSFTSKGPVGAIFYPMFSDKRNIEGHTWGNTAVSCSLLYQDFKKLNVIFSHNLNPTATIQPGCTLTVYGRR